MRCTSLSEACSVCGAEEVERQAYPSQESLIAALFSLRAWHSVGMHGERKQAMGWAEAGRAGSLKSMTQQQSPMQAGLRGSHA